MPYGDTGAPLFLPLYADNEHNWGASMDASIQKLNDAIGTLQTQVNLPSGGPNLVLATPDGAAGISALRALAVADLPPLPHLANDYASVDNLTLGDSHGNNIYFSTLQDAIELNDNQGNNFNLGIDHAGITGTGASLNVQSGDFKVTLNGNNFLIDGSPVATAATAVLLNPTADQTILGASYQLTVQGSLRIGNPSATPLASLTIIGAASGALANPIEVHSQFSNGLSAYTHSDTGFRGPSISMLRSRGTQALPTPPNVNDALGYLSWQGYDGISAYQPVANITVAALDTFSGTTRGTMMQFNTVNAASTSLQERFRIHGANCQVNNLCFGIGVGDVNFSRLGTASLALGNGTVGDKSGKLSCQLIDLGGASLSTDGALTIIGAASGQAATPVVTHGQISSALLSYVHSNSGPNGPAIGLIKSRGTQGGPTVIANDFLGYLSFQGYDGTAYVEGAQLNVQSLTAFSGTNRSSSLVVRACLSNSITLTEVLRLSNANGVNVSGVGFGVVQGNALGFAASTTGTMDAAFSRLAAASIALGNGTAGDSSGTMFLTNLGISTTNLSVGGPTAVLGVQGGITVRRHFTTNPNSPYIWFIQSGGTESSPSATAAAQLITVINTAGHNGTAYATGATLQVQAAGLWSATNQGTSYEFFATKTGTTTLTEVFRLAASAAGGYFANISEIDFVASGGKILGWNNTSINPPDTGFSRLNAASVALGNGTQGDTTGSLTLSALSQDNATVATISTTNASPLLTQSARYWDGSASQVDSWTLSSVLNAGTNGTSSLTLTHSGTAGTSRINISGVNNFNISTPSWAIGFQAGIGNANAQGFFLSATNHYCRVKTIVTTSYIGNLADNGVSALTGAVQANFGSQYYACIGGDFNDGTTYTGQVLFAPTSSSVKFVAAAVVPHINETSSGTSDYTVQQLTAIEQAFLGTNALFQDFQIAAPITNAAEDVSSIVTLTVQNNKAVAGQSVLLEGLTTFSWLNGRTVTLTTASATTVTFTDPTAHGTQASAAQIGRMSLSRFQVNTAGVITKYNSEATSAVGSAYIRGSTSNKAETGADANVLTVTPAAAVGMYRVTIVMCVSAATAATLGWTVTYKDANGAAQAPTNVALNKAGTAAPALTFSTVANDCLHGVLVIATDASATNIVVKTTFSGTSIAYKVSSTIERLI